MAVKRSLDPKIWIMRHISMSFGARALIFEYVIGTDECIRKKLNVGKNSKWRSKGHMIQKMG